MVAACCRQFYYHSFFVVWCLCWLRGLGASRRSRTVVELNYDFQEEQPIGSFVGDVKHDANLTSLYGPSVVDRLRFTFMRQYSTRLFDVDSSSGVVRSIARVDREQLCPAGVDVCVVRIDVAVRPVDYFRIVRLTVNVVDVNDHPPAFPDRQLTVQVLESAGVGTMIALSLAVDPDSPPLSVAEYRAARTTNADIFRLVHHQGVSGGFEALQLELVSGLDRELTDEYRMMIIAVDGGSPPLTGSTQLTVKVVDVNDNSPRFISANYDVVVPEDVAPGTTLLHVAAVDPDDGLNGRVSYQLIPQAAPGLTGGSGSGNLPFGINNATGAVVVLTSLDRDRGTSRYQFAISARDMGSDALATTCVVVVQLTDVNDNAPEIVVDGLLTAEAETVWPPSSAEIAQVTENAREGTFVAHVTVIDPDQGAAGRFNCSIANYTNNDEHDVNATNYFRLNQFDDTEFQLVTAVGAQIDRERRASFQFAVICVDFGRPSLTSQQQVRVVVADVNDCAPTFSSDVYKAEVIENNYVGATLLVATAYDADQGDNARLTFSLLGPQSDNFRVDPNTGEVTAFKSFDREMTSTISFIVVARDAGSPPLSGSATVVVSVVDVNDNSPEFDVAEGGKYLFGVDENQPAGTFVGQVSALDLDSKDNGNVSYAIVSDASFAWLSPEISLESVHGVFELGKFTGVLVTRQLLDAELTETYRFQVAAVDSGVPSRSSTISVIVSIGDVNDNRPSFVFPSSTSGNAVYIPSSNVQRGYVIVAVSATDPDVGPSSSIVYGLTADFNCFEIDRVSGIVSVTDESPLVGKEDGWRFSLTVTATDQDGLQTSEMLYVVVNSSVSEDILISGSGRWEAFSVDSRHVLIVLCVVALCGVLVVGLVVFIAAVRGRQRRSAVKRQSRRYNCRAAACMRLQQDSAASGPGHLPPVNAWNSTEAAQSLLLVGQTNEIDGGDVRNGQPLVKCYSNDGTVDALQLNGSQTVLKRSPNCSRKVSGAIMRPQQTLATFNFRSLQRAADTQRHHHHHHHHGHLGHHCHHPQQSSERQPASLPVTTSAHGLHHQPYSDASSMTASAQEDVRLVTQRVLVSSNNAVVVTDSEDATASDVDRNVVANLSAIVVKNNEAAKKLTIGADNSSIRRCTCMFGSSAPPSCHDETHAVAFRCRQNYDKVVVDAQRSLSAVRDVTPQNCPPVGIGDVTDGVVDGGRAEVDDDEDEAWTTTSGSYSAGDLCDEIDQLFFAQDRDRISARPPNDTLNLTKLEDDNARTHAPSPNYFLNRSHHDLDTTTAILN